MRTAPVHIGHIQIIFYQPYIAIIMTNILAGKRVNSRYLR
ncbi:hypothetical protein DSUL_140045 [Desulfovibrionales bacterium]